VPLYFLPGLSEAATPIPIQMIAYIALTVPLIGLVVYLIFIQKEAWADFGFKKPRWSTVGWAFIGLSGAFLTMMFVMMLTAYLPQSVRDSLLKPSALKISSPWEIPLMIAFCIAVGYREELLFRAYFIPRLGQIGVKPVWAVLGTSLVFGMAHFNQGLIGVATTFAIGASFGALFAYRKDYHAVAWAHALYDISIFLITLVTPNLVKP
jgi:membrane protease YdiL (CAAX protease family)